MKITKNKGVALIAVLLILMALLVLSMGFAAFTTTDHTISSSYHLSAVTFYLAQAGLEYSQYLIKHNMLIFPGWPPQHTDGVRPYADPSLPSQGYSYVGQAENSYHTTTTGQGEEHLVIWDRSWSSTATWSEAFNILGSNSACGTFELKITEKHDDNVIDTSNPDYYKSRALYITSIGKVREVPPGGNPNNGNFKNDNLYKIRAKRTLIMRIPYKLGQVLKLYQNDYDASASSNPIYYEILNDSWIEKFR